MFTNWNRKDHKVNPSWKYMSLVILVGMSLGFSPETPPLDKTQPIAAQKAMFVDSIRIGRVHVRMTSSFTKADWTRMRDAIVYLNDALVDPRFKTSLEEQIQDPAPRLAPVRLDGSRDSKRAGKKNDWKCVYDQIVFGDDALGKDGLMDLYVELIPNAQPENTAFGMTALPTSNYREAWTEKDIAAELLHGYLHTLGYKHKIEDPAKRQTQLDKTGKMDLLDGIVNTIRNAQ